MRKKRLLFNTTSALVNQMMLLISSFIIPRQILLFYGSDVNGLVTSITQFLGFITLTEMGIGSVVQSALYKPLADGDSEEISKIIKSASVFFTKIGYILIGYTIAMCIFYPKIIKSNDFSSSYVISLIIVISISTVVQYFFGMVNTLLLNADQRSYVHLRFNTIALIFNIIATIILIRCRMSIQIVKFVASLALLIKPVGMAVYVSNHYNLDKKIVFNEEPIKQKWNGIAQHIASFVLAYTDVMVLTTFSTLNNVSVYNVYYMVVAGIRQLISTMMTGVQALFGDLYAKRDSNLEKIFSVFEWIIHTGVIFIFTVAALLISSFVQIYTKGITDAEYNNPLFGILLIMAYAMYSIRLPYSTMIIAAGHYKQTQLSAIIEALLNVFLSIILVIKFGLVGVAVGTLIAMTYRTIYFVGYLTKNIIDRPMRHFIKHIFIDVIQIVLIYSSTLKMVIPTFNYFSWSIIALKVSCVAFIEIIVINLIFYRKDIEMIKKFLIKKIKS